MCSCPTYSSRVRGRIRAANGTDRRGSPVPLAAPLEGRVGGSSDSEATKRSSISKINRVGMVDTIYPRTTTQDRLLLKLYCSGCPHQVSVARSPTPTSFRLKSTGWLRKASTVLETVHHEDCHYRSRLRWTAPWPAICPAKGSKCWASTSTTAKSTASTPGESYIEHIPGAAVAEQVLAGRFAASHGFLSSF